MWLVPTIWLITAATEGHPWALGLAALFLHSTQDSSYRGEQRWGGSKCQRVHRGGAQAASKWGGWMTQELGRDTPAWLLPVPEWWVSLCRVTRGQSRTSRLSRVNSHTSALVDVEIWVHMETKEDNDRMKSCSDVCVCVCVCVVYIVCVPGNKQRKAKSQTIWDAESHAKSLAPLPSSWAPVFVCVCVCVC